MGFATGLLKVGIGLHGAGAVIGGVAGGLSSNAQSTTGLAGDIIGGALIGTAVPSALGAAAIGGLGAGALGFMKAKAGAKAAWAGIKAVAQDPRIATQAALRLQNRLGKQIGRGVGVVSFALNHPLLTIGGIGGAAGGLALMSSLDTSPTLSGARVQTNYDQQALAAEILQSSSFSPAGTVENAPQYLGRRQRELERSTRGLTQGLHRSRHG
jgi:hypothetical protein